MAEYFLVAALIVAALEVALPLLSKAFQKAPEPETGRAERNAAWGPVLEALAKVLAALKDLPAWVAIFLAGLALVWTAASAPHLCS